MSFYLKHGQLSTLLLAVVFAIAGLFVGSSAQAQDASTQKFTVAPAASSIEWVGRKLHGHHDGTVAVESGFVTFENGQLTGGEFTVNVASIVVKDVKDPKDNAKLTGHLKSADFFATDKFATASFKITSVAPIANAKVGEPNFTITGIMDIKGVTSQIAFPALVQANGSQAVGVATVKVDRTKFNVRYGSGKFFENLGDKLIYDDFELKIKLVANS